MRKFFTAIIIGLFTMSVIPAISIAKQNGAQKGAVERQQNQEKKQTKDGDCPNASMTDQNATTMNGTGDGAQDGTPDQVRDKKQDDSCLNDTVAKNGKGTGDRDGTPDQDRLKKKDESCLTS